MITTEAAKTVVRVAVAVGGGRKSVRVPPMCGNTASESTSYACTRDQCVCVCVRTSACARARVIRLLIVAAGRGGGGGGGRNGGDEENNVSHGNARRGTVSRRTGGGTDGRGGG